MPVLLLKYIQDNFQRKTIKYCSVLIVFTVTYPQIKNALFTIEVSENTQIQTENQTKLPLIDRHTHLDRSTEPLPQQ